LRGSRQPGGPAHLVALLLVLLLPGCRGELPPYQHQFTAFGTEVRIEIRGVAKAEARAAAQAVMADFRRVDRDWYAYGDGELARVNAALLQGRPATLSPQLLPLVQRALTLHRQSGGAFDPAVCALVRLWQFDREATLATAVDRPDRAEVRALRAHQGQLRDLTLTGNVLTTRRPLCLDLGGMAKGTALERARRVLTARGIRYALVDIGGSSLLALGPSSTMPTARPWRVGLKDPRGPGVLGALVLEPGETVDTSGDYARNFAAGGQRFHHILDPRTGEPSAGVASVTVITRDGELGDAASTALLAGGPGDFAARVGALGLRDALLITSDGQLLMTAPMEERLRRANGGQLPRVAWARNPS